MRRITVERGLDPRRFVVTAFGGAGPLHAVDLCTELGVETLHVPPSPGLLCGIGLLLAPWKHDETAMLGFSAGELPSGLLEERIAALDARVREQARRDGVADAKLSLQATLELRYRGQGHQIPVAYTGGDLQSTLDSFHEAHKLAFGYDRREEAVEIRLLRLRGAAPSPSDRLPLPQTRIGEDPIVARSQLWADGAFREVLVYDRARLAPGTELEGPLIIEQQDTTLIVGAQSLRVDEFGRDGADGVHCHMTNTANSPVEFIEREYPMTVLEYALAARTGGEGEFRGGRGLRRSIRLEADAVVTVHLDRTRHRPWGAAGGDPGSYSSLAAADGDGRRLLPGKSTTALRAGSTITIETAGGGWGRDHGRQKQGTSGAT